MSKLISVRYKKEDPELRPLLSLFHCQRESKKMFKNWLKLAILTVLVALVFMEKPFVIPFPWGNLVIGKNPDGTVDVTTNTGINVNGNGVNRQTKLTVGNGTFNIKDDADVMVDGKKSGAGLDVGFDKNEGIKLDNNIMVNNKTARGGVGKESQFFSELDDIVKSEQTTTSKP
ncbi:unnamed protein product [Caenorhabditis auriculariae]|uniref:Uncharacterized protein n=1 Tax=Caenorhabditis auriculariae TaxID=2777116 RepID=A0A8S1H1P4_9PELO|nr:unnamed protein product [Caenorhabditis auriculariae]